MVKNYFIRFKSKWNIQSNWQLIRIMIVFSLAGQSILFTMPLIKDFFNLSTDLNIVLKILFFIFVSLPLYQIYLLFWSLLLGEIRFFVVFIKNSIQKTGLLFKFIKKNNFII